MSVEEKNLSKKSKTAKSSIVLYVVAIIVAIIGVASLVTNVMVFRTTIASYVAQEAQGATAAQVSAASKQLISSQLLPAIFNSIGVYCGIAFVLVGAGIINDKISKGLKLLSKDELVTEIAKVSIPEKNIEKTEKEENIKEVETV
ncbi:hypothetical protein [Clostridium akagii]|uniref:hypothetical protein n=1 Tax=Clostridium akagii TaxID=91623 RepID=UPI00047B927C|nr:hypothetical protein [Clostridium akagii]